MSEENEYRALGIQYDIIKNRVATSGMELLYFQIFVMDEDYYSWSLYF